MTTNSHSGAFGIFKARLEAMAVELGGNEHVRTAVAWELKDSLAKILEARLGKGRRHFSLPYGIEWTFAGDEDFEKAVQHVTTLTCRKRSERKIVAKAPWRGAWIVQRELVVYLEGESGDIALNVAMVGGPESVHHGGKSSESWPVFLTDRGKFCISGSTFLGGSKPTATHAKSRSAAEKSLQRMVNAFFGVELSPAE